MKLKKEITKIKRPLWVRMLKVLAWILGIFIALILLILILIQLPSVQNFGRKKIVHYLENKLHTKVAINKLDIGFPTTISLQQVFFEDQSRDTLLYGNEIKVNLKMFQLLRNNIVIQEIYLDGIVAKVKRMPPDSVFNFQFIADAFASENKKDPEKQDTAPLKMQIDRIVVNKSHIIYNDPFTGNDMNVRIGNLDSKIKTFDPSHLLFDVPLIKLDGLTGYFYQRDPLPALPNGPPDEAADPNVFLQFFNKEIKLSNINLQFKNEPSRLDALLKFNDFVLHPETIDLKHLQFRLKDATLDKADIRLNVHSDNIVVKEKDTSNPVPTAKFKFISGDFKINNSHIQYNDLSKAPQPSGMDYAHMEMSGLFLHTGYMEYTKDTALVVLKEARLKEKSGFDLEEMHVTFYMIPSGIFMGNLLVKTPNSEIKDKIYLTYESLDAIKKDMGELGLFIKLDQSHIGVKDLYTFAPQLKNSPNRLPPGNTIYINTFITGKLSEMHIDHFNLHGLSRTNIDVKGLIKGLPNSKNLFADLNIKKFQSSRRDLLSLLPPKSLPDNITIPESFALNGKVSGGMENIFTDVKLNSSLGNASVRGRLKNITDSLRANYDLVLNLQGLQLGTLIKNPKMGSISGNVVVKGVGYTTSKANATFTGQLSNFGFNQYNYKNISAQGSIKSKKFNIDAFIHDPNLYGSVTANGNFIGTYPQVNLIAQIDSIKTLPLHFTDSAMLYHGKIAGNFSNTNPDHLLGDLTITNSIFVNNGKRITMDTIRLKAEDSGSTKKLSLASGFFYAEINGKYKLTQLGDVFQQSIKPYLDLGFKQTQTIIEPYSFTFRAAVNDHPVIRGFVPDLKQMKQIQINGNFSSDTGWNLLMKTPYIEYASNKIYGFNAIAGTRDSSKLKYNISFDQFINGKSLHVYTTSLSGAAANNNSTFNLNIKDPQSKDKYLVKGNLSFGDFKSFRLSLDPSELLLNYDAWKVNDQNFIQYSDSGIVASNFILSNNQQELKIESTLPLPNSPLQVTFSNFQIKTLTAIASQDSLLVNGVLNGNVNVRNLKSSPEFLADITVKDLSIYADTIGMLSAKIDNKIRDKYHVNVDLSGQGNKVNISGDYTVAEKSSFDFLIDIPQFNIKSLEGFTKGAIRQSNGFLFGKVKVDGTLDNPNIDGKINFNQTSFNVAALNGVFRIDKEAIAIINNEGISFQNFTIRDTINNQLNLNGIVRTKNFMDYSFDMGLNAKNFQAINSTKKDNDLFYGRLVFSTNLRIKGTPSLPVIDGDFTVEDKTEFTVVLPQGNQGIESREGIVRFVDRRASREDSVFMQNVDTMNRVQLRGYDVAININVDKNAVFNLIVDEGNGDFLRLKGVAQLTGGIDASGKITLVGSYEIDEGSYDLSFNFLKRKFIIQKGSRIVWTGEPTSAQIDVTAIYVANTAPLDLVGGQMAGDPVIYRQKLPFDVYLMMKGELMKPVISFDIQLPSDKNYGVATDVVNTVQSRLIQLRQEPDNLNKQVFALLLLNRFVGDDPFSNSASSSLDAGTFAKQSVSKLLSEQLNNLTANLIDGVDINFDLATTEDYSTGKKMDRTNFNVAVSKRLLNDRLTVTVGSNFELEGPQAGTGHENNFADNININYKLSKDGRYALRFYRKNDYTGTIEGYVVETGIGFVITLDYDRFRDIFRSKEQRKKKKEIKKKNKEIDQKVEEKREEVQQEPSPVNKVSNEE